MAGERVEIVPVTRPAGELRRALDGRGAAAVGDGDVLTLACAEPAAGAGPAASAEPAVFAHVFDARVPMEPVGASGLRAVALRVPRLAEAVVSFRCGSAPTGPWEVWRGRRAPPPVRRADLPDDRYERHVLRSEALGGERELTVFRPAGVARPRHALFAPDRGSWAHVVEPLVEDGTIPPTAVVGVANAPGIRRRHEYVAGAFPSRFAAHRAFFAEELTGWAERELGVGASPRHRAVAGVSNGADFAAAIGVLEPGRFGGVIALSCGMIRPAAAPPGPGSARQWLAAGTLEVAFLRATRRWAEALAAAGAEHVFRARVASHDPAMWEEEVAAALPWLFAR